MLSNFTLERKQEHNRVIFFNIKEKEGIKMKVFLKVSNNSGKVVRLNVDHILSYEETIGGSLIWMSDGDKYNVCESVDEIDFMIGSDDGKKEGNL